MTWLSNTQKLYRKSDIIECNLIWTLLSSLEFEPVFQIITKFEHKILVKRPKIKLQFFMFKKKVQTNSCLTAENNNNNFTFLILICKVNQHYNR